MKQLILFIIFIIIGAIVFAQEQKRLNQYNLQNNLAVQGYDVVSYFTEKKAVKGSTLNTIIFHGIKYQFSTVANKEEFKKNPAKFEPQYGGWCAYAMGASGEKVEIDPGTFKIADGKLYLFYNRLFNNTLPKWNKDETNLKLKADVNWKRIF
jgi:YHS domain-containing protein